MRSVDNRRYDSEKSTATTASPLPNLMRLYSVGGDGAAFAAAALGK
jgi:hypothetical protein